LIKGIILRYPIIDTDVILTDFEANTGVSTPYISSAAFQCTMNALKKASCVVIQPLMRVEVKTSKQYSHGVYSDLSRRNASDIRIEESSGDEEIIVSASVPLAKLSSYSSDIRRITSGNATFSIDFSAYEHVSEREYQELIEKRV